jgi:hypothetical protein
VLAQVCASPGRHGANAAQVPALIESPTGKKIHELMQQVRRLDSAAPTPVKAPDVTLGTPGSPVKK